VRLVDLTISLRNRPDGKVTFLEYTDHARAVAERAGQFGLEPTAFPDPKIHFASEKITAGPHGTATHVDAPWHYGPKVGDQPARTVDELPLEWFVSDAVVLDVSAKQDGGSLSPEDIQAALQGYVLKALDIVLLRTGLDRSTSPDRFQKLRELTPLAVDWLLDRGVKVIGIDAISPDRANLDEFKAGKRDRFYPAHHHGRKREFCFVELLTNLDQLPHHGFRVSVLPLKVERGSGGWCRAVAFVP
jgi:kynurenine formamidase